MQWNLLYNVQFERYMVNFKGGSFFLCSVYIKVMCGERAIIRQYNIQLFLSFVLYTASSL